MYIDRRKITIIGAGSAMFTQELVADLILTGQPWRLGLVDIDPEALAAAAGWAQRMVAAKDADITIEASLGRRDILPGGDVVVTTIGVGGRRAWEADVFIPRRYGIYQPVGLRPVTSWQEDNCLGRSAHCGPSWPLKTVPAAPVELRLQVQEAFLDAWTRDSGSRWLLGRIQQPLPERCRSEPQ